MRADPLSLLTQFPMNFQLKKAGKDLGDFPLAELRRRRDAGELTGTELVWREGMDQWAALDAVLRAEAAKTPAMALPPELPPPVPARPPANRMVWGLVAIGAVVVIISLVSAGVLIWKQSSRVSPVEVIGELQQPITRAVDQAGIEIASQPIVWKTNTLTVADVRRTAEAYRRRQWIDGYRERGHRVPSCDADALRLLETWNARNYQKDWTPNGPTPEALSDKLASHPECDDPLVLTVTAANCLDSFESIRRYERALKGFESSNHRAYPKLYAAVMLAKALGEAPSRVKTLDETALKYFGQLLTDGSLLPGEQPQFAEILVSGWGRAFFDRNSPAISDAVRAAGPAYEWLALILEGERHISESWKARGGGFADTVTKQGWAGFGEHQKEARRSLTAAWQLRPQWVQPAARMVYVALSSSDGEEMRLWFDRTVAVQLDHPGAWTDMRWGLRPRWHGSLAAMRALGLAAIATKRFDTDVPGKWFDVVRDLESEEGVPPGRHIYGRADIWPHLQEMYEGYIAEPAAARDRDGWRSSYAVVALFAGKNDVARQQMEALNWQPKPESLRGWGYEFSLLPLYVAAATGSLSKPVEEAEAAWDAYDLENCLQRFTALSHATNADARTRRFIEHRLASLPIEIRLKQGQMVDFLPTSDADLNWIAASGQFKHADDGSLEARADRDGHLIFSRVRVGAFFELNGEFEVVRSSTNSFQAGVVMGLPELNGAEWFAFQIKRNIDEGDTATFSRAWSSEQITRTITLEDGTNSFTFRLFGTYINAMVNGQEIFRQNHPFKPAKLQAGDFLVGLGAGGDRNETVIRYHHVQVRRVTPTPVRRVQ